MKILVTGSDGFIASHTIQALHKKGIDVIGIQRHLGSTQIGEVPGSALPDIIYQGDIRDKSLVEKAVGLSDGVINLAGILGTQETVDNPYPSVEVNILGALNVLEAVKLYKIPMVQIAVGNHYMNNSYSITKTTAERFCRMYAKEHGVKVNIVRALNAFGERQKWYPVKKMMPYFIRQALKNDPIGVYGMGNQLMDFVYVKDVAEILIEILLTKEIAGQVYEAGTGKGYKVREFAEWIIEDSNSNSVIVYQPMRPGEPDDSKVVASEPYPFDYTDIRSAIRQTISWYKKQPL